MAEAVSQTPVQRKLVRTAAGFYKKAKRLGRGGTTTAADLARIYLEADGKCYYCGTELDPMFATFDHVQPFERGGDNSPSNIKLCCIADNRAKFTMTEAEYRDYLTVSRICPVDGTLFKPRASDYRRGLGIYCSRRCAGTIGGRISVRPPAHP